MKKPVIDRFGERAIVIHWDNRIEKETLYPILAVKERLSEALEDRGVEVLNSYNTILIKCPFKIEYFHLYKSEIERVLQSSPEWNHSVTKFFTIPVCYDKSLGLDIAEVARLKKMTTEEVIKRHTQPVYTIYFQGFLPGFLYLGGLDEKLKISRKDEPRLHLPKGSVGLAENQTGVYPQDSAGGWQIIGNCPLEFFNTAKHPPSPFKAGDKLKFRAVSLEDYKNIKEKVEKGVYDIHSKLFDR